MAVREDFNTTTFEDEVDQIADKAIWRPLESFEKLVVFLYVVGAAGVWLFSLARGDSVEEANKNALFVGGLFLMWALSRGTRWLHKSLTALAYRSRSTREMLQHEAEAQEKFREELREEFCAMRRRLSAIEVRLGIN